MENANELNGTNTISSLTNNTLYVYSGGGYDGCLWEWNAFLVNKTGVFTDIYSSGVCGIKVKKLALEEIISKLNDTEFFTIDLDNETEILEFTSKQNASVVLHFSTKVNCIYSDLYQTAPIVFICPICGRKETIYDEEGISTAVGVGVQFNGGLAYSSKDIICSECYSSHTCNYCGEFEIDLDNMKNSEEGGGLVCEYCYDSRLEGRYKDVEEELEKDPNAWESDEEKEIAMNKLREIIARLDGK